MSILSCAVYLPLQFAQQSIKQTASQDGLPFFHVQDRLQKFHKHGLLFIHFYFHKSILFQLFHDV